MTDPAIIRKAELIAERIKLRRNFSNPLTAAQLRKHEFENPPPEHLHKR
jgi:hypothetical protein